MKLGRAIATGVAEEQPRREEEEFRLPEETEELESAVEEVPVAR
ncbi:hypothetical protein QFZ24_007305 [Streptomyces phaeochromogenes]|jgi:hypothetical protein|nr:hypothetical protein [Streptomyces phaeochromogenes]MDQ0953382.1 hypothetical protein [Streptomyces phaeochromogenes]